MFQTFVLTAYLTSAQILGRDVGACDLWFRFEGLMFSYSILQPVIQRSSCIPVSM